MTATVQLGLRDVIAKIKGISDQHYRGKLHDNALNVFNELSDDERKTFIRGVMHISSVVETGVATDKEVKILDAPISCVIDTQAATGAVITSEIERMNQEALIKLKTWALKIVVLSIVFGFVFIVVVSIAVTSEADNFIMRVLGNAGKVLSVIFASDV